MLHPITTIRHENLKVPEDESSSKLTEVVRQRSCLPQCLLRINVRPALLDCTRICGTSISTRSKQRQTPADRRYNANANEVATRACDPNRRDRELPHPARRVGCRESSNRAGRAEGLVGPCEAGCATALVPCPAARWVGGGVKWSGRPS